MKSTSDSLGERIRLRRENIKMSQGDLAAKVGISQKSLSQIETGKALPRRKTISAIATALSTTYEFFFKSSPRLVTRFPDHQPPSVEELLQMVERPDEFDSLYLANQLAQQFLAAPASMRALALRALYDNPQVLVPYLPEIVDAFPKPSRKNNSK